MTEYTNKYHVVKRNGQAIGYPTFVLRIDGNDPHSLVALSAYADSVETENPDLADELRFIVNRAMKNKINSPRELIVALQSR